MHIKEWDAIRAIANDRPIVIKKADKVSCVVMQGRMEYLVDAEKLKILTQRY